MPPVLPIHTQHHQSGDCTLEVTAHQSTLSQWSDRPVVRQLRFNLWLGQTERQLLAAGDQQHLVVVSDAVEAYVQTHLTHQAWPQIHQLEILDQQLELSTLQLFDLAEVLSAYGQQQMTLPRATKTAAAKRRRPLWWRPGSAVASLLVAVGVTTLYLRDRPATFNDSVTTSQAPKSSGLEDDVALAPPAPPAAGADNGFDANGLSDADGLSNERPEPSTAPAAPADRPAGADRFNFKASRDLLRRRQNLPQSEVDATETEAPGGEPTEAGGLDEAIAGAAPSLDLAEAPPEPLGDNRLEQESSVDAADAASAEIAGAEAEALDDGAVGAIAADEPPPAVGAPAPSAVPPLEGNADRTAAGDLEARVRQAEPFDGAASGATTSGAVASAESASEAASGAASGSILVAIATQLAPYQPTTAPFPLVYHLQLSPDGTITAMEPISENAPVILPPPALTPAPGRPLRVELTYSGTNRPTVRELLD